MKCTSTKGMKFTEFGKGDPFYRVSMHHASENAYTYENQLYNDSTILRQRVSIANMVKYENTVKRDLVASRGRLASSSTYATMDYE